VEKLKSSLHPLHVLFNKMLAIYRWEKPLSSFISMLVACYIVYTNPVYIVLVGLSLVPPLLVYGFISSCGRRQMPQKRYEDLFKRADETLELEIQKATQEKVSQHLNRYLEILLYLQKLTADLNNGIAYTRSIFKWERPKMAILLFAGSIASMVILNNCRLQLVLTYAVPILFIFNWGFVNMIHGSLVFMGSRMMKLFLGKKLPRKRSVISEEMIRVVPELEPLEIEDVIVDDSDVSSGVDSDDDLISAKESGMMSPDLTSRSSLEGVSVITKLRRRLLHSGICANGNHPYTYSSLLKKRRHCRHCGNSFCSRCCNERVPRALLGATAPAAYTEQVYVCTRCHLFLTNRWTTKPTEFVE